MARRSSGDLILEMMARDPRLRTLAPAARLLWLELIMAMQFSGVFALRFGERIPTGVALATMAAMPGEDIEVHVDALVGCGLLSREPDGALASPLLAARSARSEINRANALRGVEKRRSRTPPGQRQMPLMQAVGGSEHDGVGGSVSEPAAISDPGDVQAIAKLKAIELKPKLPISEDAFHEAGRAAVEAAGFDLATWGGNYGIVRQWLADGLVKDEIEAVIRELIAKGRKPSHLGFFKKAMEQAAARKSSGSGTAEIADWRADPCSVAWMNAREVWIFNGKQGPMPQPAEFRPGGAHYAAVAA